MAVALDNAALELQLNVTIVRGESATQKSYHGHVFDWTILATAFHGH